MSSSPPAPSPLAGRVLLLAAVLALALNMRSAVSSLGVSLGSVSDDLGLSSTDGGVLTTLPVICFALFGLLAHRIIGRIGLHRTVLLSLLAVVLGTAARAATASSVVFELATTVALAGAALGNVALPPLAKRHFPDRVAQVTALYTSAIVVGAALPSAVTVPISDAAGGWRTGLATWSVVAALCVVPWLLVLWRDRGPEHPVDGVGAPRTSVAATLRSPIAVAMTVMFAVQSSNAYVQLGWVSSVYADAGLSGAHAGALVSVLAVLGAPVALLLPLAIRRVPDQGWLVVAFTASTTAGWLGLWLAPATVPWLWAVLLGLGGGAFPWLLAMIGLKARTTEGTAALSVTVQSTGYLLGAVGPFGFGLLHELTDTWTPSILVYAGVSLLLLVGLRVAHDPRTFEQSIGRDDSGA